MRDQGIHAGKPEAVILALGRGKYIPDLRLLFACRIGKGHIEMCTLDADVNADKAVRFGQMLAGLHGIVQQIADDDAQIDIAYGKRCGNTRGGIHPDALGVHQRNFAVQNGIDHGVSRFEDGIDPNQIFVDLIQICPWSTMRGPIVWDTYTTLEMVS